jgi:hypothetical protein
MANPKFSDGEAQIDDLADALERMDRDRAGQSGDIEGLSPVAETVAGVEDAADHPERPVHTHNEYGRPDDVPPADGAK